MSRLMELFSLELGISRDDLFRIISTAPRRYKTYDIPKRSGGTREIAQPAREVKQLQYILIEHYLSKLPIHRCATAYRTGLSIYDNAVAHAGTGPILKMDFRDFFPSIRADDWIMLCRDSGIMDHVDARIAANILFRRAKGEQLMKLSIGAPSSPMLSNAIMLNFDRLVEEEASRRRITYTRYADDITFSGQRIGMLRDMTKIIPAILRSLPYPSLRLNDQKTVFVTRALRRTVTGAVIANDGSIGLGRDRRRTISAKIHRASLGEMSKAELRSLSGELAFANVIDAKFLDRMKRKYSEEVISSIKKNFVDKTDAV